MIISKISVVFTKSMSLLGDQYSFVDLPDFSLIILQKEFENRDLEALYKRYEQRAQICKPTIVHKTFITTIIIYFPGSFTLYLVVQAIISTVYISSTAISCKIAKVRTPKILQVNLLNC